MSPVGFAEVRVADGNGAPVTVDEVIRMPVDLVDAIGEASADHRVVYVMTRERTRLDHGRLSEEEPALVRSFRVATDRAFDLRGRARLASTAPDDVLDRVSGLLPADEGGITVTSSGRLAGSTNARSSSAVDVDPTTAWTTPFGSAVGQWMEIELAAAATTDQMMFAFVDDGRHSVPTRLRVEAGGETRLIDVPEQDPIRIPHHRATPVPRAARRPVPGHHRRHRAVTTVDADTEATVTTPVAIAELGFDNLPAAEFPDDSRRSAATTSSPSTERRSPCASKAREPTRWRAGRSICDVARTSPSTSSPATTSCAARRARTPGSTSTRSRSDRRRMERRSSSAHAVRCLRTRAVLPPRLGSRSLERGSTKLRLRVTDATDPFWLVLGESHNDGWRATVDDGDGRAPKLVDGYANGWRVDPKDSSSMSITLEWTPQRWVWRALAISAAVLLLCVAIVVLARRRRAPTLGPVVTTTRLRTTTSGRARRARGADRRRPGHRSRRWR